MSQNSPSASDQVKFVYVEAGASLPSTLDNNTIYFDANTQRLVVSGVSIYNPVVYESDPQVAPKTLLVTQKQYEDMKDADPSQIDDETLYLIYENSVEE